MEKTIDIRDYITVEEAALSVGYTPANITRLIRLKKLPAIKRGRRYFVLPADLNALFMFA